MFAQINATCMHCLWLYLLLTISLHESRVFWSSMRSCHQITASDKWDFWGQLRCLENTKECYMGTCLLFYKSVKFGRWIFFFCGSFSVVMEIQFLSPILFKLSESWCNRHCIQLNVLFPVIVWQNVTLKTTFVLHSKWAWNNNNTFRQPIIGNEMLCQVQ